MKIYCVEYYKGNAWFAQPTQKFFAKKENAKKFITYLKTKSSYEISSISEIKTILISDT